MGFPPGLLWPIRKAVDPGCGVHGLEVSRSAWVADQTGLPRGGTPPAPLAAPIVVVRNFRSSVRAMAAIRAGSGRTPASTAYAGTLVPSTATGLSTTRHAATAGPSFEPAESHRSATCGSPLCRADAAVGTGTSAGTQRIGSVKAPDTRRAAAAGSADGRTSSIWLSFTVVTSCLTSKWTHGREWAPVGAHRGDTQVMPLAQRGAIEFLVVLAASWKKNLQRGFIKPAFQDGTGKSSGSAPSISASTASP